MGGGQKKGENQKRREKQWQIADSSLWGTLKTKIEEKPNWIPRKGRHKNKQKQELSKSLEFIKPLRLSDEVDSSL